MSFGELQLRIRQSTPPQSSSVLFENVDKSLIILDIPRTIEEAQVFASETPTRRIYSSQPISNPFETPEPRDGDQYAGSNKSPAMQIADLMTAATVTSSLELLDSCGYNGPYLLPRCVLDEADDPLVPASANSATTAAFIPPAAEYLVGPLAQLSQTLKSVQTPSFDLVILDPPWPNRSARRKTRNHDYRTVATLSDMGDLLSNIPLSSHLSANGLVAFWVTNNSAILDFMTNSSTGFFPRHGLEPVAEWTWVKITTKGEPIFEIDSVWRKPWEKLLIAKRIGANTPAALKHKTILAVPDLHSRKPNLRRLFAEVLPPDFKGLEVFARNLTAGWWSCGDESLLFQQQQCWVG